MTRPLTEEDRRAIRYLEDQERIKALNEARAAKLVSHGPAAQEHADNWAPYLEWMAERENKDEE